MTWAGSCGDLGQRYVEKLGETKRYSDANSCGRKAVGLCGSAQHAGVCTLLARLKVSGLPARFAKIVARRPFRPFSAHLMHAMTPCTVLLAEVFLRVV